MQILGVWQNSLNVNAGAAMKSGLRLTYQQYEGVRYILSHHFDDAKQCHLRNVLPGTGKFLKFIITLRCFTLD